jgi:hypothetical protein
MIFDKSCLGKHVECPCEDECTTVKECIEYSKRCELERKNFATDLIQWRHDMSKDYTIHAMWVAEHEYLESFRDNGYQAFCAKPDHCDTCGKACKQKVIK